MPAFLLREEGRVRGNVKRVGPPKGGPTALRGNPWRVKPMGAPIRLVVSAGAVNASRRGYSNPVRGRCRRRDPLACTRFTVLVCAVGHPKSTRGSTCPYSRSRPLWPGERVVAMRGFRGMSSEGGRKHMKGLLPASAGGKAKQQQARRATNVVRAGWKPIAAQGCRASVLGVPRNPMRGSDHCRKAVRTPAGVLNTLKDQSD